MAAPHAAHREQQATIELLASSNNEPVFGRLIWRDNLTPPNVGLDCIAAVNADRDTEAPGRSPEPLVQQIHPLPFVPSQLASVPCLQRRCKSAFEQTGH